ncbi:dihydroorotase [Shimazuella kribbensis]|uniref:dihydroorotase n=1 Tax=Shimazuella kribbensis TaxID=139808 RepID=UPI00041AA06D|nr:dihydroorotase [Shimazuella kribbensis]
MAKILLKNGRILGAEGDELLTRDILIHGNQIEQIGENIEDNDAEIIDLDGKFVSPGFVDLHVHLREPGYTHKETIETGATAAVRGGFTTIACMPNTRPVIDTVEVVEEILAKAKAAGKARVLPIGAITTRQLGSEHTDFEALKEAGAFALSDDGVGVQNSQMMRVAMRKAKKLGLPIVAHCEDDTLVKGGVVHEGAFAAKHGLTGMPSLSESIHIGRDILLAEDTGVHYHVCHISAKESVRLVKEAKSRGQKVTAEVTPHHLLLCEDDIPDVDANWKMNPPLRAKEDREALIIALQDGSIDFIATDHAPHTEEEKAAGIELAPFGIVGLETAFPLLYTKLVKTGQFTLRRLVELMSTIPAERFDLPYGKLAEGQLADITVIDLEQEQEIDPKSFLSKGRNTPFVGWKTKGWPTLTIVDGKIVWTAE